MTSQTGGRTGRDHTTKVLVTAASRHGSTAEIAQAIADELARCGIDAAVLDPEQVESDDGYDGVILGSAVYAGHWREPANACRSLGQRRAAVPTIHLGKCRAIVRTSRSASAPAVAPAVHAVSAAPLCRLSHVAPVGTGMWRPAGRRVLTGGMTVEGEYEPSPRRWVREQVELYESSGGREGATLLDTGLPVVIITNRGVRTGRLRKTPVMRVEHEGRYAAVASVGGAPSHPGWYYNLRADPRVELQDGRRRQEMIAREVTGAERDLWWERAVAAYPPYAEYQEKTSRQIPVFVLEPEG